LRASHQLTLIDVEALHLSLEESVAIARLHQRQASRLVSIERLQQLTKGWAAGLILLLQQSSTDLEPNGLSSQDSMSDALFDYFAAEVMRHTEPGVQDFLRRSALLPQMTAESAAALTGNPRAKEILTDFARRNYFIVSRPGKRQTYEYHPLFRGFLAKQAGHVIDPTELRSLQQKAGALLLQTGNYEAAADLLTTAHDTAALTRLVIEQAPTLIAQGRHAVLGDWIGRLPKSAREGEPWLDYWFGISIVWVSPIEARGCFDRAFRQFEKLQDLAVCAETWCAAVDSYIVSWSEFKTLDTWLERARKFSDTTLAALPRETQVRFTVAMFLALMYRQADHPEMKLWAHRAEEIFRSTDSVALQVYVGNHLLLYLTWWVGDMGRAKQLQEALLKSARRAGRGGKIEILTHAFQSALCWMLAENREAIAAAGRGLEVANSEGFHLWDAFLGCQALFACLSEGDLATAEAYISKVSGVLDPKKDHDLAWGGFVKGWYLDCQGARSEALATLLAAKEIVDRVGTDFYTSAVYNDLGRLLVDSGKREEGMKLIDTAYAVADRIDSDPIRYLALRSKAELFLREGDGVGCLEPLRECLAIARHRGFNNHAWWRSEPMTELYATALEHGIETDYVVANIKRRKLKPPKGSRCLEAWPFPLKIHTLGRFALLRDGKPLRFEGKTQKKPLELLKLLIALGGREIAEARIADALWPQAEAWQARQNLKSALHRLRKLIGEEVLILSEGKLSLDAQQVWVDVWAFERLLNESREHLHAARLRQAIDAGQRAMKLYKGTFLAADDQPFLMPLRERLRARLLAHLGDLAHAQCEAKACTESLALYRKGLEIDPLTESFYQGLMHCHQCLHQPAEALKAYDTCRRLLKSQLGIEPSPKTHALAEDIRRTAS
jgi:LuxR family transcriptional regulator, maltose regulon positive regulatory protein